MPKPLVSDEFWELIRPLLPPEPPWNVGNITSGCITTFHDGSQDSFVCGYDVVSVVLFVFVLRE